ncbi:septal ring lytic transglycosylase RlpA family protein [Salinisphaera aquimarina]|uniref:Endolytic peptidoglycan transglycosylase RlpA n=1 Tax=Salinisphaera aquimarina TaxID=2094031 RepID=A0ABV7EW39_9GAMM
MSTALAWIGRRGNLHGICCHALLLSGLFATCVLTGCATERAPRPAPDSPAPPAESPTEDTRPVFQTGEASFYAHSFDGKRTANGETYSSKRLTAAHRTLAFGTRVRVTNVDNGRHVNVRINDRGPYAQDRIIDLSPRAAKRLGMTEDGVATVELRILK